MTSAAQRDSTQDILALQMTGTESVTGLRQVAAERLAKHRNRRAGLLKRQTGVAADRCEKPLAVPSAGMLQVRDAVAARYEGTQSYREYLAAEAGRALLQVPEEVEVTAHKACATAEVQMRLLKEPERVRGSDREKALARAFTANASADDAPSVRERIQKPTSGPAEEIELSLPLDFAEEQHDKLLTEISSGGLTIRLYDGLGAAKADPAVLKPNRRRMAEDTRTTPEELRQLDREIEWRHGSGSTQAHTLETTPIPANIIEFPRELIAPRKARPRLAEGPQSEDAAPEPQLRIFEVEPEGISTEPLAPESTTAPVWQELLLDVVEAPHAASRSTAADAHLTFPPQVAPIGKRLLAAAIDSCCLLTAIASFVEIACRCGGTHLLQGPRPLLAAAVGVSLLIFFIGYQMLFFTFNEATPGMRAARIALCTFGDDNPSRKAMRLRVLATLLAASPLGIGLLWLFLDEQELGWHDRISRMYQRAY